MPSVGTGVAIASLDPCQRRLVFRRDLFDQTTMARLAGHFCTLLRGLVEAPSRRLSALPLLSAAERHQVAVEWNATAAPYAADRCLHELFAEQAARRPEAPAAPCAAWASARTFWWGSAPTGRPRW